MDSDAAKALVSAIGLANLIVKYSQLTADYAEAISLADQHVAVPGGVKAQPVWAKLVGSNPENAAAFLRALFDKDQGRLLVFFFDLAHADAAHQQYITQTPQRAEAFYHWYRDSAPAAHFPRTPSRWQANILQKLPMDESGKLRFPGGREVWATGTESDDEILLHRAPLEALAAVAELEQKRGARLSPQAAQLLAQRHNEWRSLFPDFEKLPALEAPGFSALAAFSDSAAKAAPARRNLLLGEWHSLVKLIVLGSQSGSLSQTQAADAFRQACEAMQSPNASAGAIETLRAMMGPAADLDAVLARRLLRLSGARFEAFEDVERLQNVPRFASLADPPDDNQTLAALSGSVYAAVLDPSYLLVAEDPQLLRKHRFFSPDDPKHMLFAQSWLSVSSDSPGSNFVGGFQSFEDVAQELRKQTVGPMQHESDAAPEPRPAESGPTDAPPPGGPTAPAGDLVFRAGGRIVEVYATVTDSRGRYVDDLTAQQFTVLEDGQSKPVFAFENHTTAVSVALVFDATGSMVNTLPPLKSAAMRLVDDLRPQDSIAVYSFNDRVTELQSFTSDKNAAKRAIVKTHAFGITALYDTLVRVNRDLSARAGKKVIVVFTDGRDNASMLMADTAIERAKASGIPIYTIAEGEALGQSQLIAQLNRISQSTGGTAFLIHNPYEIGAVFEKVSHDLMHGYLVDFQPSPGNAREWRKIEIVLDGAKTLQVRAREGFYVE